MSCACIDQRLPHPPLNHGGVLPLPFEIREIILSHVLAHLCPTHLFSHSLISREIYSANMPLAYEKYPVVLTDKNYRQFFYGLLRPTALTDLEVAPPSFIISDASASLSFTSPDIPHKTKLLARVKSLRIESPQAFYHVTLMVREWPLIRAWLYGEGFKFDVDWRQVMFASLCIFDISSQVVAAVSASKGWMESLRAQKFGRWSKTETGEAHVVCLDIPKGFQSGSEIHKSDMSWVISFAYSLMDTLDYLELRNVDMSKWRWSESAFRGELPLEIKVIMAPECYLKEARPVNPVFPAQQICSIWEGCRAFYQAHEAVSRMYEEGALDTEPRFRTKFVFQNFGAATPNHPTLVSLKESLSIALTGLQREIGRWSLFEPLISIQAPVSRYTEEGAKIWSMEIPGYHGIRVGGEDDLRRDMRGCKLEAGRLQMQGWMEVLAFLNKIVDR
ncbi:hypothetical protein B9479_002164 [Cryptococcus floricola]|uniref:Uncharacterized protein n=1 Tax=Cryptococcus floricola TaxID=2591691 RepID=A0A5D3B4K8_9TREE|nr:hypothetical protein B9479_002164 [Cryptococcus floricola]